ncbi:S41 family peptidase [Maricaulis maris]|uniref:S41 family peptidase n=1 Tax=Maricaulis maris TaxID=74318 RepID=UPI003B8DB4B6
MSQSLFVQAVLAAGGALSLASAATAQLPTEGTYTFTLSSAHYGTLQGQLSFEASDGGLRARNDQYAFTFDETGAGALTFADGRHHEARLVVGADGPVIVTTSGLLRGEWQLEAQAPAPERDYSALVDVMEQISTAWIYDPRLIQTPEFTTFRQGFTACIDTVSDDAGLIYCFDRNWDGSLFSHYEILRPLNTMEGLLDEADAAAEDRPVARHEAVEPGIALVTIDSFFGIAIEAQIDAAMSAAIDSGAHSLIVDLRENGGGTAAAIPVAARILEERQVLGTFIANAWWRDNETLPGNELLEVRPVMNGRSQQEVMGELISTGYTAASLDPAETVFDGDVYVLISERTASASEALVGMIKMSGRATLIGETTAGEMLSSNFFPLPSDFSLRLPVADFYLSDGTRIDGNGVTPDIAVAAEDALDRALAEARAH